jgi:hypothetical protein
VGSFEGRFGGGLFDSLLLLPVVIGFISEMIISARMQVKCCIASVDHYNSDVWSETERVHRDLK